MKEINGKEEREEDERGIGNFEAPSILGTRVTPMGPIKGILHSLTLRNEISSTHRSCYFLQRVKDL